MISESYSGMCFKVVHDGSIFIIKRSASGLEELEYIITNEELEKARQKVGELFPL